MEQNTGTFDFLHHFNSFTKTGGGWGAGYFTLY